MKDPSKRTQPRATNTQARQLTQEPSAPHTRRAIQRRPDNQPHVFASHGRIERRTIAMARVKQHDLAQIERIERTGEWNERTIADERLRTRERDGEGQTIARIGWANRTKERTIASA